LGGRPGIAVTILGIEGTRAFEELINDIKEAGYIGSKPVKEIYAQKTIKSKVQNLISGIVNQLGRYAAKKRVRTAVEEWLGDFYPDFPLTTYYVPITNLKLAIPLTIGKVTLRPLSSELVEHLIYSHDYVVNSAKASDEQKEHQKGRVVEFLRAENSDVIAEIHQAVDEDLGYEFCISDTEKALNVLRCYGYFLYSRSQQAYIGLQGRLSKGKFGILSIIPEKRTGLSYRRSGPLIPYDLSGDNLDRVKRWGLDFLSQLLLDGPSNEIEIDLLAGIEWAGRASQSFEAEARYLNLWTAIEILLTTDGEKKRKETPGQLIAKRASLILDFTNEKERERFRNLWNNKLYEVRCGLVHKGYHVELADYLPKLELYAPMVIMVCIQKLVAGNTWLTKAKFFSSLEA